MMPPMQVRPTTVTIDLAALRHNLGVIRRLAPGHAVCAVVKADAYGHGLERVGRTLADAGIYDYICGLHPAMKGKIEVKE